MNELISHSEVEAFGQCEVDIKKFWSKVSKQVDCWLWAGFINPDGYGRFWAQGRMHNAHRFIYEVSFGLIQDRKEIDHTCRNRACVNPEHLREVSHKENLENRNGAYKNSSSGIRGVSWSKLHRKWRVQVKHNGKVKYIGLFSDIKEAEKAAIEARNARFTHNDSDRKL